MLRFASHDPVRVNGSKSALRSGSIFQLSKLFIVLSFCCHSYKSREASPPDQPLLSDFQIVLLLMMCRIRTGVIRTWKHPEPAAGSGNSASDYSGCVPLLNFVLNQKFDCKLRRKIGNARVFQNFLKVFIIPLL